MWKLYNKQSPRKSSRPMHKIDGKIKIKRFLTSLLSGILIFLASWFYQNSSFTVVKEDTFFNFVNLFKYKLLNKILKSDPTKNKQFVFINTGKDLNLIDDTSGYGNIEVSDRYKILKLLQIIDNSKLKPQFVVLDLQFDYPYKYTADKAIQKKIRDSKLDIFLPDTIIDDSIQSEIKKSNNIAISVSLKAGKIDTPIYKARYGIVDYETYGSNLNKFRLHYNDINENSLPSLLNSKADGVVYSGSNYFTKCNGQLSFNYIWPEYYYDEETIKSNSKNQLYHIGSLLSIKNNTGLIQNIIKGKIIFIGNFDGDMHDIMYGTPFGKLPGTVILCDIYLSLLNGNQYVPKLWILYLIICFSLLSHRAIYKEWPNMVFNYKLKSKRFLLFINRFPFVKKAFDYYLRLMLVSYISILVFNINVSLAPAIIFIGLESMYEIWEQRKMKKLKNAQL
jgi:hypothetical protein